MVDTSSALSFASPGFRYHSNVEGDHRRAATATAARPLKPAVTKRLAAPLLGAACAPVRVAFAFASAFDEDVGFPSGP